MMPALYIIFELYLKKNAFVMKYQQVNGVPKVSNIKMFTTTKINN